MSAFLSSRIAGALGLAGSLNEAARIAADNPCLACGLAFEIRPIEPERASAYRGGNETPADAAWLPATEAPRSSVPAASR